MMDQSDKNHTARMLTLRLCQRGATIIAVVHRLVVAAEGVRASLEAGRVAGAARCAAVVAVAERAGSAG